MAFDKTENVNFARRFIGQKVRLNFDYPAESKDEKGVAYTINYGTVEGIKFQDGEPLRAYFMYVDVPLGAVTGFCVAIIDREMNEYPQLVVALEGDSVTDEEIREATNPQERYYNIQILRN